MLRSICRGGFIAIFMVSSGVFPAFADGTEQLGPPSIPIASGSGFAMGGVGLFQYNENGTYTNLDGAIFVAVPEDAVVKQVLLYWMGEHYPQSGGDNLCRIEGIDVVGDLIGGSTNFFSVVYEAAYRVDITDLDLVQPGANTLWIEGLDFSFRNTGAGVLVIYDDGTEADIQLQDGLDLAYWRLLPPLDKAEPVHFAFEPADVPRVAEIPLFVGLVGKNRPNLTEVTVGGETLQYFNLFSSLDGDEWDSVLLEVEVPAGATELSIVLKSESDGTDNNPASFGWVTAGLALALPDAGFQCGPCQGGLYELTLQYLGAVNKARIHVVQPGSNSWRFLNYSGVVNPGETITFTGLNTDGSLGPWIAIYVNGRLHTKMRTTCDRPIGPGTRSGSFLVAGGVSLFGGFLCPLDSAPQPGGDSSCADGKPKSLTFTLTGGTCEDSSNQQPAPLFFCAGDSTGLESAYIVVTDHPDPMNPQARFLWQGTVNQGQSFTVDAEAAGLSRFREAIYLFVLDAHFSPVQCIMVHTSCHVPLQVGDTFGGLELTGYGAYGTSAKGHGMHKPSHLFLRYWLRIAFGL